MKKACLFAVLMTLLFTESLFIARAQNVPNLPSGESSSLINASVDVELPDAPQPQPRQTALLDPRTESSSTMEFPHAATISAAAITARHKGDPTKLERWSYHASEVNLIAGLAWDMWRTQKMLAHPIKGVLYTIPCEDIIIERPDWGMVCLPNEPMAPVVMWVNPTPSYRWFSEGGWAKVFGDYNAPAVITANTLLDVGIWLGDRALWHRGGKWRKVAILVNSYKGIGHWVDGTGDLFYVRQTEHYYVPKGAYNIQWQ